MARLIRSAVLACEPRTLHLPATVAPATPGVALIVDLERQMTTLKTESAALQQRLQAWQDDEAARTARVFEDAMARGLAEGLAQGRTLAAAEGRESLRKETMRVHVLLDELCRQQAVRADECEDVLVAIAFAAVCKMLGQRAVDVDGVRTLIRQAGAELCDAEVRVRLHPDDHALLADCEHALPSGFTLVADDSVALGGCMLDSTGGTLDARLETQLAELAALLRATRAARREARDMAA